MGDQRAWREAVTAAVICLSLNAPLCWVPWACQLPGLCINSTAGGDTIPGILAQLDGFGNFS